MNLGRETETLEFKKTTGELKEGIISIGAILNKHHKGELYFGVKPDGTPIGQEISEKTLREISQAIAAHIEPQIFPEIEAVSVGDCRCIVVRFEGYSTPYFAYNVARIRVADEDKVMSQQELSAYFRKQGDPAENWERQISDINIANVSDAQVQRYVERGHIAKRIAFEYTEKQVALNKLLLTNGSYLLNAGMALFCESIYTDLQMAVFAGKERLTFLDIQRSRGGVFEQVQAAENYIAKNIRWRVEFNGSLERKEIPEIPLDAVREALINSYCHKDYAACQCNEVTIYKDRVEIYNPGSFPAGYQPEDFISGQERPIRRNPLIAQTLYYSKDVESFGTGLKRITDACNAAKCKVEFKTLKSGFVVVFYRENLVGDLGGTPQVAPQVTPQVAAQEEEQPEIIRTILVFCAQAHTVSEIMEHCGYKDRKHFKQTYLKPLIEAGQLAMTIPEKPNSRSQKYVAVKNV